MLDAKFVTHGTRKNSGIILDLKFQEHYSIQYNTRVVPSSVCHKFCIQHLFSSASSFSFIYPTACPFSPLEFISKIFCVMTSIFAPWEWIDCIPSLLLPPPPPDSAYRICYKMAYYGQISDFKMSMEASWQNTSIYHFRIFKNCLPDGRQCN